MHAEVNLDTLCRHFEDGEVVDLESLKKKGLISKSCKRVKLLGRGEMTKSLDIRLDDYSKSAKESIEAVK
jgi:large subunit ribosomal protein L15